MIKKLVLSLTAIAFSVIADPLQAQDYGFHPAISDSFSLSIGVMRSGNSFQLESDALDNLGDLIDFPDSLGVSNHDTFFNGQLRWKHGNEKKWSLFAQYFSSEANGTATLEQNLQWGENVFREGSFVSSGAKLAVIRVFWGRSFIKNDRSDLGVGAGIHNIDLSAFIEGEILTDNETTGVRRAGVGASQILPNLGAWYNFSPARRWLLYSRVDWISANIGDYGGTLWNAKAGVNFQAWRHLGLDLSWQYFNLHGSVDKTDWQGSVDMTYSGPVLGITGNW